MSESVSEYRKSSWIQKLFPIHSFELKKFLPIAFLKFLISFVYCILYNLKDALVVTAKHSGAEVIPVLKSSVVFPLAILSVILYVKLTNHFKRSTLFYSIVCFFLLFLLFYGFILYPNIERFTPNHSADWMVSRLGVKWSNWIAVYRHWAHSLFFVTAELWGQIVIFILYWSFVNQICTVKEAKRTYTLFIAVGDLAMIVTGPLMNYYARKYFGQSYVFTLQTVLIYVFIAGLLIIINYYWMNRFALNDQGCIARVVDRKILKEKNRLSLRKSLKHILTSKYLLAIAVLVVGCGLTINIVEITWKAYVKEYCPSTAEYQIYISRSYTMVGIASLVMVLFLSGSMIRRFGWHINAQLVPWSIGIVGSLFFLLSIFRGYIGPHYLAVLSFFGAFHSVFCKTIKYSFFDPTKEMAYIPLDPESKVKGKAAVDVIGSRFGKTSSSFFHLMIFYLTGASSVMAVSAYLLPVLLLTSAYWSYSVFYLNKSLLKKEKKAAETPSFAETEPTPTV